MEVGKADVEGGVGDLMGLIIRKAVFWDSNGPGVTEFFNHLCAYHRYPQNHAKAGQIVEEEDDDVDAGLYLNSALVLPPPNPLMRPLRVEYGQRPGQERASEPRKQVWV